MGVTGMLQTKIFRDDWEIGQRLNGFGATKTEFVEVVEAAVGARADAVPHHPVTAPGTFSYHEGTRALRDLFVAKGWESNRTKNVESVYDPQTGIKIIFQNTNSACDVCDPKAISPKGNASEEAIMLGLKAKCLWPEMDEENQKRLNGPVWYLCVFANGEDVLAELSRPSAVEGGQFAGFLERIFILRHNEWNPITPSKKVDYPLFQDFDISVTRK
jgi:hypothetical protein